MALLEIVTFFDIFWMLFIFYSEFILILVLQTIGPKVPSYKLILNY